LTEIHIHFHSNLAESTPTLLFIGIQTVPCD
jgi:hypothetical protein